MSIEKIHEIRHSFIEDVISIAIEAFKDKRGVLPAGIPIKSVYFAGRTLFLDVEFNGKLDAITLVHSEETFGFFSGGPRRLMSIKALRLMEDLMVDCEIKHGPKWRLH